MLLFPWLGDEWVLKLSEVYTRLEIETYTGKANMKETKLLKDYRELFTDVKSDGTRILVKGDPGIGKTTFTHKLAFDWATGSLSYFDLVLVIKLKFISEYQRVESMVVDQLKCIADNIEVSEALLEDYLRSGKDRVLLVLDGLDEINLKHFPQIQKILNGETYRKCCILATTRPHVAESLQNKSTSVAKILGFSKEKAEDFVTHIIPEKATRTQFFDQLYQRNMSEMFRVPLIIQALALLFREHQQLPVSYTMTYDELVLYLRKTCKDSKGLTEDEIQAAMAEVNELAFKGLTREDKQLVFSRDEIKNENIFKLGILVAEKGGSGFRPTTVLWFLHKTLQEYCAAHHVVQRLEINDRGPWEALLQRLHRDAEKYQTQVESENNFRVPKHHPKHSSEQLLSSAMRKLYERVKVHPERNKVIFEFADIMLENGIFEAECDMKIFWNILWHHSIVDETLSSEEKNALFTFLLEAFSKETQRSKDEAKAHLLRFNRLSNTVRSLMMRSFFMTLGMMKPWELVDMGMTDQLFTATDSMLQFFVYFAQLQQTIANYRILISFILGKSSLQHIQYIVPGITELIVQYSFDKDKGTTVPIEHICTAISHFVTQARSHVNTVEMNNILRNNPALVQLKAPYTGENRLGEQSGPSYKHAALWINGIFRKHNTGFLNAINNKLRTLTNIHIAEITCLSAVDCPNARTQFVQALHQSSLVSIKLYLVDPRITTELVKNLPETTRGLVIHESNRRTIPSCHRFPIRVNLSFLSLVNCTANLNSPSFPNLRQLYIEKAVTGQTVDMLDAISRMPKLEDLNIFSTPLREFAPHVVNMLKHQSLRFVNLENCNMSFDDGAIILQSIQDGDLDHIASLSLLGNKDFITLAPTFTEICDVHDIDLQISMGSKKVKPETARAGLKARLFSWLRAFITRIRLPFRRRPNRPLEQFNC